MKEDTDNLEIWKDISGYEGDYQISSLGRVKSIKGYYNNRCYGTYGGPEKILSPTDNGQGYLIVFLCKNGVRKNYYVHRLVAEAFVENPNMYTYVNHLDFNKHNNHAENLSWCTQKQNINYSVPNMIHKPHQHPPNRTTGERYIRKRNNSYEVAITYLHFYRYTTSFEQAIKLRDEAIKKGGILDDTISVEQRA